MRVKGKFGRDASWEAVGEESSRQRHSQLGPLHLHLHQHLLSHEPNPGFTG